MTNKDAADITNKIATLKARCIKTQSIKTYNKLVTEIWKLEKELNTPSFKLKRANAKATTYMFSAN